MPTSPRIQFARFNPKARVVVSPFDVGVSQIGGRPGARFGPKEVLTRLEKFYAHPDNLLSFDWTEIRTPPPQSHGMDLISGEQRLVHLGGSHDTIVHAFEILQTSWRNDRLLVINFDPHPDVRDPKIFGWTSGSGFFDCKKKFSCIHKYLQIGAQKHVFPAEALKHVDDILWWNEIPKVNRTSYLIQRLESETYSFDGFFLSVDLDCIEGFVGVSAPCAMGFNYQEILEVLSWACYNHKLRGFGIYELAPNLDPTPLSAIRGAHLVYSCLRAK
jgi:arginase family enzyme